MDYISGSNKLSGRLLKLTLLQASMIILGFFIFLLIKQIYQQEIMGGAVRHDLREAILADLEGREHKTISSHSVLSFVALPLVLIIGRNAASIFYRASKKRRQIKRDIKSKLLLDRIHEGKNRKISLYLRSFSDETMLKRKKSIWWYLFMEGDLFGLEWETIELKLSSLVHKSFPMIAIGTSGKNLGGGRLPSNDSDWQQLATLLMDKASIIFVIPSTSQGVLWEIDQLHKHREKTIYIMPPSNYYTSTQKSDVENYWSAICAETSKLGLKIPNYREKGAFFTFDEHGELAGTYEFSLDFGFMDSNSLSGLLRSKDIT